MTHKYHGTIRKNVSTPELLEWFTKPDYIKAVEIKEHLEQVGTEFKYGNVGMILVDMGRVTLY